MRTTVDAIYEKGKLVLPEPLSLPEGAHLRVTIESADPDSCVRRIAVTRYELRLVVDAFPTSWESKSSASQEATGTRGAGFPPTLSHGNHHGGFRGKG
jgi:predicted DNA-binding antitoxin AbrB/MazE fold protein